MIRRLIAIVLIVLGLGTVGAAIASATVWKPDTTVTVPLPDKPAANYVISAPGVLNIVNESVKIRAYAEDADTPVFLAMGRTDEVEAWAAPSDHGKITGLKTWDALTYETVDAVVEPPPEDADAAEDQEEIETNPANSDMWLTQVNGVGEVSYTWQEVPGRWSMIVATDGDGPAPMVELTWEREVPTPALIPGIILGTLIALAGAALLALSILSKPALAADASEPEQTEPPIRESAQPAALAEEAPTDDDGDLTPVEDIMAALEATTQVEEPTFGAFPALAAEPEDAQPEDAQPEITGAPVSERANDEDQPLTRREIRERERQRERESMLGLGREEAKEWPTQETPIVPAEPIGRQGQRRRWWQRKRVEEPAPATGPIIIDEDTGEIIITGEIDLSSLTPQASADSWRATWGLDKNTPTRWLPVVKQPQEGHSDD